MTLEGANAFLENENFTLYTVNSLSSGEYAVVMPKSVMGMINVLIDFHQKGNFDALQTGSKTKEDLLNEVNSTYKIAKSTYSNFILVYPMLNEDDYVNVVRSNDKQKMFDEVKKIGAVTSEIYKKITESGMDASKIDQKIIILEKTTEDTDFVTWLKGQMPNFVEGLKIVEEKKEEVNPFMGMNPFGPAPVQEKVVENTTPPVAPTMGSSIFDNVAPSTPIPPVTTNTVPPVTEEVKPQTVSNDIFASPVANTPVNEVVPTSNGQVEQQASSNSIFGEPSVSSSSVNNASLNTPSITEAPKPVNSVDLEGTTAFRPIPGDTTQVQENMQSLVNEAKSIEEVQAEHKGSKGIANLLILLVILVGVTIASIELGKFLYNVYGR
mgnify:FL=1